MSAKPTSPPKIDFQAIADEFRFLNPNDPGAWPPLPKMTVLAGIVLALVIGGWWFLWSDQLVELEATPQTGLIHFDQQGFDFRLVRQLFQQGAE